MNMKKLSYNEEFVLEGSVYIFTQKDGGQIALKRVRESAGKVGKSKPKSSFVPPTMEEFKLYFKTNGYKEDVGERAWRGYDVADWHKSNGEKVMNWKQTCIQVWFKSENLIIKQQQTSPSINFFQ